MTRLTCLFLSTLARPTFQSDMIYTNTCVHQARSRAVSLSQKVNLKSSKLVLNCVCVCGREGCLTSSFVTPHISLREVLSLNLELTESPRLVGQRAPGTSLSPFPQHWCYRHTAPCLPCMWELRIWTRDLTRAQSAFQTASLQTPKWYLTPLRPFLWLVNSWLNHSCRKVVWMSLSLSL